MSEKRSCRIPYTLNGIKSKTVGDGQHGTARWATKQEIRQTYAHIPFEPELWRQGKNLPDQQGLILGCEGPKGHVTAVVDTDDIHALVTAASGAGKTAFFLYPNIEYALATGMSFLCTDTKGDLFRNYAGIARECYGYQTATGRAEVHAQGQLHRSQDWCSPHAGEAPTVSRLGHPFRRTLRGARESPEASSLCR